MAGAVTGLRSASRLDAAQLVDILADAFDADPFFRWMFGPDEARFRLGLRSWLGLVIGFALPRGNGWLAGDDGAAVWLPPGTELTGGDELAAAGRLLEELVGDRVTDVIAAIGGGSIGVPDAPHWLCVYVGVRPHAQGMGLGRLLMQPGIGAADQAGVPCHLVSTNPATATFYERLGFRVLSVVSAGQGVPALRPMWRDARPA
jgi:GNAT superfamily N-acetyltransferase